MVGAFAPLKMAGKHAPIEEVGSDDGQAEIVAPQADTSVTCTQGMIHIVVGPQHLYIRPDCLRQHYHSPMTPTIVSLRDTK